MERPAALRVLLNNPPVLEVQEPLYDRPEFGRAGLAYVAGYLREHMDVEICLVDSKFERLDFEQTLERIRQFEPQVVGFTAFTNEIVQAATMADRVKTVLPDVVTVIGGVHATALPKATLEEFDCFDFSVHGEGEATFLEFCRAIESAHSVADIDGVAHRSGGKVRVNRPRQRSLDLDSIPFPAWDLLPAASTYFIQTARGCPFACKFCMNPNGRVARQRSVGNVIEELKLVVEKYHPKQIWYGDEIFTVDVPRTKRLLRAKIAAGLHQKFEWGATTHVRFVDDELFGLMHDSNCYLVGFGIETGDEEKLRKIGKGTTIELMMRAREGARKAKVPITTYCIIGQIDETLASIHSTIDLTVRLNPDLPIFGVMVPYPGTEVARLAARGEGGYRLLSRDWNEYNKQVGGALAFAGLSRSRIERLQLYAYVKVFVVNHRFIDLARFIWEYRTAGLSLVKRIALGWRGGARESVSERAIDPAESEEIALATEDWQRWQLDELARMKRSSRELVSYGRRDSA
jgi:anaerobic magnesium-protoporphyrin IX monomethyl ester cyclase